MLRRMRKVLRDQRGFTLIELLVVLIVLGVLVAVAVPLYSGYVSQSRCAEAVNLIGAIKGKADSLRAKDGSYPASMSLTDIIPAAKEREFGYTYADKVITATGNGGKVPATDKITVTLSETAPPGWVGEENCKDATP